MLFFKVEQSYHLIHFVSLTIVAFVLVSARISIKPFWVRQSHSSYSFHFCYSYYPHSANFMDSSHNSMEVSRTQTVREDSPRINNDEPCGSDSDNDADYVPTRRLFTSQSSSSQSTCTFSKRRRKYIYKTRPQRSNRRSDRHLQWMSMLTLADGEIRNKKCCSTLRCFQTLNLKRLRQSMTSVFSASRSTRRSMLSQMLTSDNSFFFDGRKVCSMFLVEAFRFSSELQSTVRSSFGQADNSSNICHLRSAQHNLNPPVSDNMEEDNVDFQSINQVERDNSVKRDGIITFLNRTCLLYTSPSPRDA